MRRAARPLLRAKESYTAIVENNTLTNVSDVEKLKTAKAARPIGLEKPLKFECGVKGEFTEDGCDVKSPKPMRSCDAFATSQNFNHPATAIMRLRKGFTGNEFGSSTRRPAAIRTTRSVP